jgi:hypothetical protein
MTTAPLDEAFPTLLTGRFAGWAAEDFWHYVFDPAQLAQASHFEDLGSLLEFWFCA